MTETISAAGPALRPARRRIDVKAVLWKLALELGPLTVFFASYQQAGIFAATAIYMGVTLLVALVSWWREGRLPVLPLVGTVLVLVMGALTLALDDETFIVMRPTLVNLLFAGALLFGMLTRRPLLRIVFGESLALTERGWHGLTLRVFLFLLFMAALNEAIWRTCPLDVWVDFKVFAVLPLDAAFVACMWPYVRRNHPPRDGAPGSAAARAGLSAT
jgi:intracellular septation protein